MQPSAHPFRRNPAPTFIDHTPRLVRDFEITAPVSPSQSPEMFSGAGGMGMAAFGAGPLYTNAVMGQKPSAQQRENVRKASSTILREDSIRVELHDDIHASFGEQDSRPDSLPHARTDQPTYVKEDPDDKMMTQTSLLHLPKGNASQDLAYFLKTTGPNAPTRRPRKVEDHPRRAMSASKNVLKWLRVGQRRSPVSVADANFELNDALEADMKFQDEGGLLLPPTIEQKLSSTGKKYFALKPEGKSEEQVLGQMPELKPPILESRVSVSFTDDTRYSSGLDTSTYTRFPHGTPPPSRQPSVSLGTDSEGVIRMISQPSSPVRPAASNPPTPESASIVAESYQVDLAEHPAKRSLDAFGGLTSHPVNARSPSGNIVPKLALPQEEFPVKFPRLGRDVEIKHPSPRRLGSHPVLLHRTPSMSASMCVRSFSDSPGPPPPKSPLRLCRDPRSIEGLMSTARVTPKIAPSIKSVSEYASDIEPPLIIPSVITECTGPIKRPRSRERHATKHPLYPTSRKEREEKTKQRKIRDKPGFSQTIDAVVNSPPPSARRLRKARPAIQIPAFKPAPLATRTSSSASSNASWKKVTETTLSPVSTVPSQDEKSIEEGKTGYSPTGTNGSPSSATIALSPVMLVAEEVPLPKARSTPKPTKLTLRGEGNKYAPRPRSASMSRTAAKRRSRGSIATISRPNTPETAKVRGKKNSTPPLLSPPPNRALPPTPPASGSEFKRQKPSSKRPSPTDSQSKELPLPPNETLSTPSLQLRHQHHPSTSLSKSLPHITTQDLRTAPSSSSSNTATCAAARIDARIDALEKQNTHLYAVLMAVLRTNGALNTGPLAHGFGLTDPTEAERNGAMAWETRVARRSTAAGRHAASSSNGSASLDLYMSTRRDGSRLNDG